MKTQRKTGIWDLKENSEIEQLPVGTEFNVVDGGTDADGDEYLILELGNDPGHRFKVIGDEVFDKLMLKEIEGLNNV